jgi:endonuclease G
MNITISKISSLFLLLFIVALCSLWLNNIGNKWWYPPIIAACAALSIISSLFLGDSDSIARNIAQGVEKFLFATEFRALVSLGALLVVSIGVTWLVWRSWPADKEYLAIQVYRKSPVQGNYAVGTVVFVHSVTDGITRQDTVGETGFAKITGVPIPTSAAIQMNEARNNIQWTWGTAAFDIKELPMTRSYNLTEVPLENWTQLATPSINILSTVNPAQKLMNRQAAFMKGDASFQKDNAPWGLPDADLVINRYSYILGLTPQRLPRWVAYAYTPSTREFIRKFQFQIDPAIPEDVQPTKQDYNMSGYDRGNLVSQMDVAFKGELAMMEADYLTVITPQTPTLNRIQWAELERATRQLATLVGQVYILAGPLYLGGKELKTIGPHKIPVPTHFFRIVCWIVSGEVKTAAYLVPNDITKNMKVRSFAVSISEIENKAHIVCLPNLHQEIDQTIKTQVHYLPGL